MQELKTNLMTVFVGIRLKDILSVLEKLTELERKSLYKEYTFRKKETIENLTIFEKYNNKLIISKMKRELYKENYKPEDNIETRLFFLILNNYTESEIMSILETLTEEEMNVLYKYFGKCLSNETANDNLTQEELKKLKTVMGRLKINLYRLHNNKKIIIDITDIFEGITVEELKNILTNLKSQDTNILFHIFGPNLNQRILATNKIIKDFKKTDIYKKITGEKEKPINLTFKPLLEVFNQFRLPNETDDELLVRIKSLIREDKMNLFIKKYGDTLTTPNKWCSLTTEEEYEIRKLVVNMKKKM